MLFQDLWSITTASLSPFQIYGVTYVVFLLTFWSSGLVLLALDVARPHVLERFRCQPFEKFDKGSTLKVAKNVVANQLTTYPICFFLFWPVAARRLSFSEELPSIQRLLWTFVLFAGLTEVMFYWSHRIFHYPPLYKRFHKIHHEIKAPFGICALYFHPVEHVQAAVEGIAPALLLGSHVSLYIFWTCIATLNVVLHHSGYDFEPYLLDSLWPFKSMTQQHDYHHFAFDRCFGVIGICDWLHGTDGGFKDHLALWKQAQT